jgi:hypothetical protein
VGGIDEKDWRISKNNGNNFIFGLWGLILSVAIVNYAAGFGGVVIGFFLFPVTLFSAPWYALVQWGSWYPLAVIYGGGIFSSILFGLGKLLSGNDY